MIQCIHWKSAKNISGKLCLVERFITRVSTILTNLGEYLAVTTRH